MATEEEEEVVRRLRRMQEAYEQDPSLPGVKQLCYTLRLLGSHISGVPDSVLVKVWMSIKDETLKQLHLYNRKIKPCNPTAEPEKESIDQLIQTISLLLCKCPDLPFDLFWEECAWAIIQLSAQEETEVAMGDMYRARELLQGLLHLMAASCSCESPFSNPRLDEASVTKLYILLRLSLKLKEEDDEPLARLFPKWNPFKNTRLGLQIILKVVQKEPAPSLDVTQPAKHLLKEFCLANEEEWTGCIASLLHQILQTYLEKGPMFLQQKPTKALLRLFSSQTFAQTFLDCITLNPDTHRSSASALAGAFQIFELVYAEQYSEAIVSCCLAKAVDEQSDSVLLRLQCLNLVGKIQAHKWNFSEDPNAPCRVWAETDIRNLFKILLQDSSIRVRRSAMQIFLNLSASNIVNEEMLEVCLMKTRDQDEKVRLMAFQNLRNTPMKTLVACLTEADWNAIRKRGLSEEKKGIRGLVEALLLDYVTTELVAESPSERLQSLNLVGTKRDCSEHHFSFVYDNVESIWNRELEYLSAIFIP